MIKKIKADQLKPRIYVASQYHERLNSTGYADNLKEDVISLYGQISAIADVYDALTSDRCYHNKNLPTDVLKKLFA